MVKMVAQICVYKMFLLCSGSVASDDVMLRYATLSSKLLNPEKLFIVTFSRISKKWNPRAENFGRTCDPEPGTHLIGGSWDWRPRTLKVGPAARNPVPISKPRPGTLKVGRKTQDSNHMLDLRPRILKVGFSIHGLKTLDPCHKQNSGQPKTIIRT